MNPRQDDALQPALEEAKETLTEALQEACRADVIRADTGELIRIEEVLAIAGDAAKRAVSIRRRLRDDSQGDVPDDAPDQPELEVEPTGEHRFFEGTDGVRWDVFAVHPSRDVAGRAQLPEPYRRGWLSFDGGNEKRRLSPIPDGWEVLGPGELRALCESAEPVRTSRERRLSGGEERPV